ncbi:IS110 family transposase [Clostridium sp. SYSU_GA19001]|uniref:IS110 family transposase n=1 Tax=Clostridium caldaquaticum TaxID=2940653 RepID=UPI002076E07A|nr:IS110 family transposase [Clostridium caldaquaticum]MCM8710246.1 IS110 family transposase [Clostridium caldaquaticum]
MQVVYKKCCGLDVHKKVVVACFINGKNKETLTFGTMTEDLIELVEYIKKSSSEAVAMESTGVFWKPIYNLLEAENIKTLVVNAKHMKAVPGRKTDVKDAEWIADLLKHGLLRASYIPSRDQRELRELIRYRKSITEERTREVTRVQKILEGANIKVSSVASNIMGVSVRKMLDSIIDGNLNPEALSLLAKGTLKNKIPELQKSLTGLIGEHQKKLLSVQLQHIDFINKQIEDLSKEIESRMQDDRELIELIDSIPGIGQRAAELIIAEIGTDMSRFPTANHLASWAGLCPGNNESAGKKKSGQIREGNKHLRAILVEAAWVSARMKNTYFYSQYHRIAARRGKLRAAVAVAHSILIVIYQILSKKIPYHELGSDYFNSLNKDTKVKKLTKQLEALGYTVTMQEASAAKS